jgi:hypothetical protein
MLQDNSNRRILVSQKYPPGDLNPGSLVTRSKWVVHWTSEVGQNEVRLQALHSTGNTVKSDQVLSGQVISDQVGLGQFRLDQARSGKFWSG